MNAFFQRLFFLAPTDASSSCAPTGGSLADVPPGRTACLQAFSPQLSPQRWAHLQAYGLTPGRCLRVVQHQPVTVVQVEHSELALEADLARQIEVTLVE